MASGFIGNEVPRKGLRVRIPCPPLMTCELESMHSCWAALFPRGLWKSIREQTRARNYYFR